MQQAGGGGVRRPLAFDELQEPAPVISIFKVVSAYARLARLVLSSYSIQVKTQLTIRSSTANKMEVFFKVPESSRQKRKKNQKVQLPSGWTWDAVHNFFMTHFDASDVNVIAKDIVFHGYKYSEACKKHAKNKIMFNFLWTEKGPLWLQSGQIVYRRLKAAVTRMIRSAKIKDITNKLRDTCETQIHLQNQITEKENEITNLHSKNIVYRKKMVRYRNKAKSKEEEVCLQKQVGVHARTHTTHTPHII